MSHPSTWALLTRQQIDQAADRFGLMDATDGVTKAVLARQLLALCYPELVAHSAGTFNLVSSDFGKLHYISTGASSQITLVDPADGDVVWLSRIYGTGNIDIRATSSGVDVAIGGSDYLTGGIDYNAGGIRLAANGATVGLRYVAVMGSLPRWVVFSSYGSITNLS